MGLRKKVIEQRFELLKLICHEVKISEKGKYYGIPLSYPKEETKTISLNERTLKKGNFFRDFGKKRTFKLPPQMLLMVNKDGRQIMKTRKGNWVNLTMKRLERIVLQIPKIEREVFEKKLEKHPIYKGKNFHDIVWIFYFKGRKAKYLAENAAFHHIPIFGNFTSFKEAKKFFGYDFMGDEDFKNFFSNSSYNKLFFYASLLEKEDRLALVHHMKLGRQNYLIDTLNQWSEIREKEGQEKFPFFRIPSSHPELREIHDDISYKYNFFKAADFSDKEYQVKSDLLEEFKQEGLKFDLLNSERKIFLAGCRSHHCISSRTSYIKSDILFSFYVGGEIYDCQCKNNKIYEFRGYRNKDVPDDYKKRVQKCFDICLERTENERQDSNEPLRIWKITSPETKDEVESIDDVFGEGVQLLEDYELPF